MTEGPEETLNITIEREFPFPAEKIWRALTQPHLLEEWLMKNDFKPVLDHPFSFRAEWGAVEGRVLEIEPQRKLAYTWGDHNLKSTVTWTLEPTDAGTLLRMEQTGFRQDQPRYFQGAKAGWPRFLAALDELLARIE